MLFLIKYLTTLSLCTLTARCYDVNLFFSRKPLAYCNLNVFQLFLLHTPKLHFPQIQKIVNLLALVKDFMNSDTVLRYLQEQHSNDNLEARKLIIVIKTIII